ncbi:hypothetical protein P9112_000642 [Eukaryota sp. TZLM1-RC]
MLDIENCYSFLTDGQLKAQVKRCLNCEAKPCRDACPAHCSPADFITALENFLPSDFGRAAKLILSANPFGGVCGSICPDTFCQAACKRSKIDCAIDIPAVQASIIHRARQLEVLPKLNTPLAFTHKAAVIGAGPAGLTAALSLAQRNIAVDVYEKEEVAGGSLRLIPETRLPSSVIDNDVAAIKDHPFIYLMTSKTADITEVSKKYDAVICSTGAQKERSLDVQGSEKCVLASQYLRNPDKFASQAKEVLVVGGGAVAVDCAIKTRQANPDANVSLVYRRGLVDMPITKHEREMLMATNADVIPRTVLTAVEDDIVHTVRVSMGNRASGSKSSVVEGTESKLPADIVVLALGSSPDVPNLPENVFVCGDSKTGPSTAIECVKEGKKVAAEVFERLEGKPLEYCKKNFCEEGCAEHIPGYSHQPISLATTTFGIPIRNPFILSAAPSTDGVEEVRAAFNKGWAGVIMKTAFHEVPIHIPNEYMACIDENTYGNCDNVSGRDLSEVIADVKVLRKEWPDRLIGASSGGSMTGDDEADRASWQKHTKMLEDAGTQLIEYSLSCPQGAEGSQGNEGSMVSQSARLTRKVIGWVMECSNPEIPKLFKLTGAVTDPMTLMRAAVEVFEQYPDKKAGVTLANSFPSLELVEDKVSANGKYRQARIVGIHGKGITAISNLTLANVAETPWKRNHFELSASGGAMDYRSAADFMALGASTVQFCTLPTKYGLQILDELENGLSHYLAARGFSSVEELIGCLLPTPVTDFMELTPVKKISLVNNDSCIQCLNCTRCPYLALSLVDGKLETDASKCIGCSICAQALCPTDSITMVDRTEEQLKACRH